MEIMRGCVLHVKAAKDREAYADFSAASNFDNPPETISSNERFGSSKLETNVVYPLQKLDLTEFWVPLSAPEDEGVQQGGQHPPFLYNLYAVATHEGTLQEGHYTSFVNRGKNGWCYFDDAMVYKRVAPKHVVNRNAYVLFLSE